MVGGVRRAATVTTCGRIVGWRRWWVGWWRDISWWAVGGCGRVARRWDLHTLSGGIACCIREASVIVGALLVADNFPDLGGACHSRARCGTDIFHWKAIDEARLIGEALVVILAGIVVATSNWDDHQWTRGSRSWNRALLRSSKKTSISLAGNGKQEESDDLHDVVLVAFLFRECLFCEIWRSRPNQIGYAVV